MTAPVMNIYYAPSTSGFYDLRIHGNKMPRDAVPMSDAEYQAHMAAQSQGKVLVWQDGGLTQQDPPAPPLPMQIAMLEATVTPRMMQEALLGSTNTFPSGEFAGKTSAQAIALIRGQIAVMRAQL